MGFGTGQKIGISISVIGFLMCAIGACTPFWQHGEIDVDTLTKFFSLSIPIIGGIKLATIDIGIWWYCRQYLDEKNCEFYEFKDVDSPKVWTYRIASIFCVVMSFTGALAGLSQLCCSRGGRTIFQGVAAFIAGGAGIVTSALFVSNSTTEKKLLTHLLEEELDYDWAIYVYTIGAFILFFVSFVLCFALPDNPITHVFPATAGGGTVIVSNTTQQMQSYGGPQYAYPNPMYTGQSSPMPPGQQWPTAAPTQPQHHNGDITKSHAWGSAEPENARVE